MDTVDDRPMWCPNRRALFVGLGATGFLAACSAAPAAPPPAADAASDAASKPSSAAAVPALADVAAVPVGGGTVVDGVLVVQPEAGVFKAFDAACPHNGVKVTAPEQGVATCPAHKSTFAIKDGARLSGPATRGLTEIPVQVRDGRILRA
ncbi:Rieske (2Fe-2S) protein [Dactylosporangium sp. AC04546]|uniref:Rieske (2Fe-2S) protein n=1 Tax=Dactylosporangium sp. AC04546 TaxID=2862460 RepID=UPI001EDE71B5|nr:Rieske (2Fe-2S) protein [Dactylosporangium sp. AC04546]WVK79898.1 Rieske (2Fe-2S) protein [Dactylosporangium sp. AC04546]